MQANVKKWKYKTIAIMAPNSVSCLLRWRCFPSFPLWVVLWNVRRVPAQAPVQGQTGKHVICQQSSDELLAQIPAQVSSRSHTSLRSFRIPPSRPAAVSLQVWLLYLVLVDVSEWSSDVVTPTLFTGPHGHTHTVFIGCLSPCTWCLSIREFAPWSFQFRSTPAECSLGSRVL